MMVYKFSPSSRDGLELDYEEERRTEATPATASPAPQTAKKQPALNALTNAELIQKEGAPLLDDRQLQTLLKMDAVQNKDGGFDLYGKDGTTPAMTVDKNGCVGVATHGAVDSAESINALMEGAQMYKTLHPGESCYLSGGDEKSTLMAAYVSEKAGLKVWNQTGKKLDDLAKTDPQYAELKKKIDAEWEKKNSPTPAQNQPGVTMAPAPAIVPLGKNEPVFEDNTNVGQWIADALNKLGENPQTEKDATPPANLFTTGYAGTWGRIDDASRSGLASPVADGLCRKFDGCATGSDLSGDPAQRRTLVADIDLQQQRTKPALGGLANG